MEKIINNLPSNLFDLTKEQETASKDMYDGKIIKCLVAPFHHYSQLETKIPFSKSVYLFPERELSYRQLKVFISTIVSSSIDDEFKIITAHQNIILDMIDACVRVLTEREEIINCPCKTFYANIHTIRYEIFENENYQLSKAEKYYTMDKINKLISKINGEIKTSEYASILQQIELIGEPLISN